MKKSNAGRPTLYSAELAEKICNRVMLDPRGLPTICRENGDLPHSDTIYEWIAKNDQFSDMYARAKRAQITMLVDRMIENILIVDGKNEIMKMRLLTDTIKWQACKLVPRLYGDRTESKVDVTVQSQDDFVKWAAMQGLVTSKENKDV